MNKLTKSDIASEIESLKKLTPSGPFARKTAASIAIAVEALQGEVDVTAEEFGDLSSNERGSAEETLAWMNGLSRSKPSAGWSTLCA